MHRTLCTVTVALAAVLISVAGCRGPVQNEDPEAATATVADDAPPADATRFQGSAYAAFEADVSWHEARARCQEMGGHLAVIETAEEAEFIADFADGRYLFLGATDEETEGEWRWVNGAAWDYTNWLDGQPNNWNDEDYLATYDGGEWVDVDAEGDEFWMPTGYVCEWDNAE